MYFAEKKKKKQTIFNPLTQSVSLQLGLQSFTLRVIIEWYLLIPVIFIVFWFFLNFFNVVLGVGILYHLQSVFFSG
jgi:hypothetical protein